MFWGGMSLEAKTELVFITGPNIGRRSKGLTSQRYIEEILVDHVVPFSGYIGENFIFMQDDARPHTAAIVRQYLEEVEVLVMAWPARSPDLNPIEHRASMGRTEKKGTIKKHGAYESRRESNRN